jgi:zinc/manganese transport system ATP-binding protein
MQPQITLTNICVAYGREPALQDISGVFQAGSLTAIAGPNGAGKSTLLKTILGIIRPKSGHIVFSNIAREDIAYLPQTAAVQRDFPLTVLEAVSTGFWNNIGNQGSIDKTLIGRAKAALDEVGLAGLEQRPIGSLSGGQFQRLLFARVMVQDAKVIMLDEPFAAVDGETTARLIQIILGWHREGRTVICVLHDLLLIQKYFPNSFILAGKCLGHGHTHQMLEQNLLSYDLDIAELCAGPDAAAHDQHAGHQHGHDHTHHSHS